MQSKSELGWPWRIISFSWLNSISLLQSTPTESKISLAKKCDISFMKLISSVWMNFIKFYWLSLTTSLKHSTPFLSISAILTNKSMRCSLVFACTELIK